MLTIMIRILDKVRLMQERTRANTTRPWAEGLKYKVNTTNNVPFLVVCNGCHPSWVSINYIILFITMHIPGTPESFTLLYSENSTAFSNIPEKHFYQIIRKGILGWRPAELTHVYACCCLIEVTHMSSYYCVCLSVCACICWTLST